MLAVPGKSSAMCAETMIFSLCRKLHQTRQLVLGQQLAQQPLGRLLVAPALDQDVEHDAGLVHGSPKPMLYPGNFEHDLVQMPFVAHPGKAATDLVGKLVPNFSAHCRTVFVADDDAAGRQQLLYYAQPERKAEI
jgi:hypothetical protein